MKYFDVNQYEIMKEKIRQDPNTRRAVAFTFDIVNDNDKEDIPCLQFIQLMVYGGCLYMTVLFRSNDIKYAFASNIYGLMKLHIKFADDLGLKVGDFNYVCNNAHWKEV